MKTVRIAVAPAVEADDTMDNRLDNCAKAAHGTGKRDADGALPFMVG